MIELRPKGRPGIDQTEGLVVGTRAKETAVTGRAQGATEASQSGWSREQGEYAARQSWSGVGRPAMVEIFGFNISIMGNCGSVLSREVRSDLHFSNFTLTVVRITDWKGPR